MDYLSARALGIGNGEDHLVLNSVSNAAKAYRHLDGYGRINCYLDNDEAGRRTLEALGTRYGERGVGLLRYLWRMQGLERTPAKDACRKADAT